MLSIKLENKLIYPFLILAFSTLSACSTINRTPLNIIHQCPATNYEEIETSVQKDYFEREYRNYLETVVNEHNTIVFGEITDCESKWIKNNRWTHANKVGKDMWTFYIIHVYETFKGNKRSMPYNLKFAQHGGYISENDYYDHSFYTDIEKGNQYIIFLDKRNDEREFTIREPNSIIPIKTHTYGKTYNFNGDMFQELKEIIEKSK